MPLIVPYAADKLPGTWRGINGLFEITCPACGQSVRRDPANRAVADDGTIAGALGCPFPGCSWLVPAVRLNNWRPLKKVSEPETIEPVAAPRTSR